jgi:ribosomal protein L11 methyltransferase
MKYVELEVTFNQLEPWRDILLSELDGLGFESFVNTKTGLKSYASEEVYSRIDLSFLKDFESVTNFENRLIEDKNWNEEWEKNFDPVFVEDKLVIYAPFHENIFSQKMKILIQPQMSFGTGHHQTTWLMAQRLFELELQHKKVLDMGTGTGVLAILAEKLGASSVFAPDIDEWSYNNAIENVELNDCKRIQVEMGGHELIEEKQFDLIIANINKNVLIEHLSVYSDCLKSGGKLLLSGFFTTDCSDLEAHATRYGFIFEDKFAKDEWALMQFQK